MTNELFIGGVSVDTIQDLDISITKEVYSIIDPSKRKADFTKTVAIPGSKNNDNLFASLFDVNFNIRSATQLNPDFNPSKKASCVYLQDTFTQIRGHCQLDNITTLDNKVIYNIQIYGNAKVLFSDIANLTLNDLTTLGTAVWNDTTIEDSWTDVFDATIKPCYPYVNRGKVKWDIVNRRWYYDWEAFKPWMYIKHIFNAIISEAGYQIEEGSFLETEQFKRVIMECDVKKFQQDATAIAALEVKANRNATQNITPVSNANAGLAAQHYTKAIVFNIETSDPAAQYDNATGTTTIAEDGYTNIEAFFDTSSTTYVDGGLEFCIVHKRGSTYTKLTSQVQQITVLNPATLDQSFRLAVDSYYMLAGDEIRVCLGDYFGNNGANNTNLYNVQIGSSNNGLRVYIDGQINYGQTFSIADILPSMSQNDFIMGIAKMFNLYFDTIFETGLVIETRDEYFLDTYEDWTQKLDIEKEFKIIPQGLLENKEIQFVYKENEDDLSRAYKSQVGYEYGYKRLLFDNDFVKNVRKVELPFTLVPLYNDVDFGNVNMVTLFDGNPQEKSSVPIIAYYGNLKAGQMRYRSYGGSYTLHTTYPYAGPIDDVTTPNYDLAWGQQDIYFHKTPGENGISISNQGLYNQFHRRQWLETGDRNAKLIEAYFRIGADDVHAASFRKKYWIKDAYYRLLEISDFNPNTTETTKVKLLRLPLYAGLENSPAVISGGGGQGGGNGDIGQIQITVKKGNVNSSGNNINDVVNGVVVTGTGNTIGYGCTNVIVNGNDNYIAPGIFNVTIINSNGNIVTTPNTTIIGEVLTPYSMEDYTLLRTLNTSSTLANVRMVLSTLINDLAIKGVLDRISGYEGLLTAGSASTILVGSIVGTRVNSEISAKGYKIYAPLRSISGTAEIRAALYTSTGDGSGALLAQSTHFIDVGTTVQDCDFDIDYDIQPDTPYYLCLHSDAQFEILQDVAGTNEKFIKTGETYPTFPATIAGATASAFNVAMAIYYKT